MAFNPTLPVDGSLLEAGEMRDQFNGLAELMAALEGRIAALEAAMPGTARDPAGVSPLTVSSGDFVVQTVIEKVNEVLAALKW